MRYRNIFLACTVFITHISFAMHGKTQIMLRQKRMQENLQKRQLQINRDIKLLRLCDTDITNTDLSFQNKLLKKIKTLLDNGANVDAQTENQFTSLYLACFNKNIPLIKLLIEYGVNVNARIEDGFAPIHLAADDGSFDIVNILTKAQADVNIQSFTDKQTALHLALDKGCYNKDKLRLLKYWPVDGLNIEPLENAPKGTHRIRVGSCRIIFFIDEKEHNIFIVDIGPRKNIYKNICFSID